MKLKKMLLGYAVLYTVSHIGRKIYKGVTSPEFIDVINDVADMFKPEDENDIKPSADMYNVTEGEDE